MEDRARGWVSGNTVSIVSSNPNVLSDPKAHKSFFMLCFHLWSCFCLAVSTVSNVAGSPSQLNLVDTTTIQIIIEVLEYSGGVAGLPQAFAQGASVKKPLLIFNALATHKLGYAQIFVAAEIRACLLGHSFGKFLGRWFFEVARMVGVSKAVPGEADYRAESRRGGQASMINTDLPLCS